MDAMSTIASTSTSTRDEFVENADHSDRPYQQDTNKRRRLLTIGTGVALVGFAAAFVALTASKNDHTMSKPILGQGGQGEGEGDRGMPSFRHRRVREHHNHKERHHGQEEEEEEAVFNMEWSQYHVPFGGGVASTDGQPTDASAAVREESISTLLEVPPLSELVQEEEVQGDISFMVDFAIIGNPKCGTTFLMHWLSRTKDTFVHNGELCSMSKNMPHELTNKYYHQVTDSGRIALTDEGHRIKGGLKCPKEISTESGLDNWSRFFPETKFIIATRHPVSWFQSFYNYHAYGRWPKRIPHPNELIGACYDGSEYLCTENCGSMMPGNSKICTDRANFHHSLSRLGKTPMDTPEELQLLGHGMSIVPQKGKVFLMESSQLIPENASSERLSEDISTFLDLKYDLRPLKDREGYGTESHQYKDDEAKEAFIDICDDEFLPLREVLVQQGEEAALWIKNYFMKSEDVIVSHPDEFLKLLDKWGEDPCRAD